MLRLILPYCVLTVSILLCAPVRSVRTCVLGCIHCRDCRGRCSVCCVQYSGLAVSTRDGESSRLTQGSVRSASGAFRMAHTSSHAFRSSPLQSSVIGSSPVASGFSLRSIVMISNIGGRTPDKRRRLFTATEPSWHCSCKSRSSRLFIFAVARRVAEFGAGQGRESASALYC